MGTIYRFTKTLQSCQTLQLIRLEKSWVTRTRSVTCPSSPTSITASLPLPIPSLPKPVLLLAIRLVKFVPPTLALTRKSVVSPSSQLVCLSTSRPTSSKDQVKPSLTLSTLSTPPVTLISPLKSLLPSVLPMVPSSSSITSKVFACRLRPCSVRPSVRRLSPSSSSTRLIVVSSSSRSMVKPCTRTSSVSLRTLTSLSPPTSVTIWVSPSRATPPTVPLLSVPPSSVGPSPLPTSPVSTLRSSRFPLTSS